MSEIQAWKKDLQIVLTDLESQASLKPSELVIVGCSTSEVIGKKIGTAGTKEIAEMIFSALNDFRERNQIELAFQCCEHLNRAIVMESKSAQARGLEQVAVIPVRRAGGAMATFAYGHMEDPVVVEFVKADAGIDIGDTFIGMHLKHVAVPIRSAVLEVGHAHVTMAKTRPKLIGGERAVYKQSDENLSCT
ncbi:TIGR01440 family protein [Metabacillus sp. RGM 3146]|uniref:TIGR01440 family protein n=1 Tax=Metabacillus sp. RGM 3146 TaxID=3401092 RepID=UPI003B9C5920